MEKSLSIILEVLTHQQTKLPPLSIKEVQVVMEHVSILQSFLREKEDKVEEKKGAKTETKKINKPATKKK